MSRLRCVDCNTDRLAGGWCHGDGTVSCATCRRRPQPLDAAVVRKRVDERGYVRVHFKNAPWQYEHRLVAAAMLGRRLRSSESVHHKNHDRADNRPENLGVMPRGEHTAHHNSEQPKRRRVA